MYSKEDTVAIVFEWNSKKITDEFDSLILDRNRSDSTRNLHRELEYLIQIRSFINDETFLGARSLARIANGISFGRDLLKECIARLDSSSEKFHIVLNALYLIVPTFYRASPEKKPEKTYKILHISDLHFGANHKYSEDKHLHLSKHERPTLLKDLVRTATRDKWLDEVDCVVVSGDLTWQASESEFKEASDFLNELLLKFHVSKENCIVVPGNHDVRWSADKKGQLLKTSNDPMLSYRNFHTLFFGQEPNQHLSSKTKVDDIMVFGFSSVQLEPKSHGIGFVGLSQIDEIHDSIDEKEKSETRIKIAVIHHHLLPVQDMEYGYSRDFHEHISITIDSQRVIQKLIEEEYSIVLHGHQHTPFIGAERRPSLLKAEQNSRELIIVGSPSTSVDIMHTGDYGRTGFSLVEIHRRQLIIKPYIWESVFHSFVNNTEISEWLQT